MEEKKTTNNVPANNGKRVRKKKLRLKKSVRRTAGALLMVTSLIVAAIPTGSASADAGDAYEAIGGAAPAPSITEVLTTYGKYATSSVPANTKNNEFGAYQLNVYKDGDQYKAVTKTIGGRDYLEVDLTGFLENSLKKPVFEVYRNGDITDTATDFVINKYIKSGDYVSTSIKLNSKIGFNTGADGVDHWEDGTYYYEETTAAKTVIDKTSNKTVKYIEVRVDTYEKKTQTVGGAVGGGFDDDGSDATPESDPTSPEGSDDTEVISDENSTEETSAEGDENTENEEGNEGDVIVITTSTPTPTPSPDSNDNSNNEEGNDAEVTPTPTAEPTSTPSDSSEATEDNSSNKSEASVIKENHLLDYYGTGSSFSGALKVAEAGDKYTVTLLDFDGNIFKQFKDVVEGTLISEPSDKPSKSGFKFAGWDFSFLTTPIMQNTVIYPQYWKLVDTDIVCKNQGTVNYIGSNAFSGNPGLTEIEIPDYSLLEEIGESAFENNIGITSINFGKKLISIDKNAFANCSSLQNVNFPSEGSALKTICDGAFHDTGVTSFSPPGSIDKIGSGAFYGCSALTNINLAGLGSCDMGNYVFAKCTGITKVDLETNGSINNLDSVKGLFADCTSLTEASLPASFTGKLQAGTFANCPMTTLFVRNASSDFNDGEFDKTMIVIDGPEPDFIISGTPNSSIDPSDANCKVNSYKTSIKNDYTYRYRLSDAVYYDYVNYNVYPHDSKFISEHEADQKHENATEHTQTPEKGFIFKIGNAGNLAKIHDYHKSSTGGYDLEIYDKAGYLGKTFIYSIDPEVFKGITSINQLVLNDNIRSLGTDSFNGCSSLSELWINTCQDSNGISVGDQAFYKNTALEKVTFTSKGSGKSSIGKLSFGDCNALTNIDFLDDNHINGNINYYADFQSIADDAFFLSGRTNEITFKGPMKQGYLPYEKAIAGTKGFISDQSIYILYTTGNPQNLTCQYKLHFTGDGKSRYDSSSNTGGEAGKSYPDGVYLLSYPNQTTNVAAVGETPRTIEDIKQDIANSVVVPLMENDCDYYTSNVTIPYGIDYIDIAESKINDVAYEYTYFQEDDGSGNKIWLYKPTNVDHTSYRLFKYTKGLETVTFANGGPEIFPDKMFECAPDLTSVIFNGNVTDLGDLPFYWPDSEDIPKTSSDDYYSTFQHTELKSPSKVSTVVFNGESTASSADPLYSCAAGTGIIKSDDGSVVTFEQMLPGRGTVVGSTYVTADEIGEVGAFKAYAARDCDAIEEVDLSNVKEYTKILEGVFLDCDNLARVYMPENYISLSPTSFAYITYPMEVTFPGNQYDMQKNIFDPASKDQTTLPKVKFNVHKDAKSLIGYADDYLNISIGTYLADNIKVEFRNYDGTLLKSKNVMSPGYGNQIYTDSDPVPTKAGSIFAGWAATDSAGNPVTMSTPLYEDMVFTALFSDKTVNVTFLDYDGTVLQATKTVAAGFPGSNYKPTDPVRPGYTFTGYKGVDSNGTTIADFYTTPLDYDTIFTAQYSQGTINIIFNDYDGTLFYTETNVSAPTIGRYHLPPTDPVRANYTFTGWTGVDVQGNIITDINTETLNYTTTFTAQYTTGKVVKVKFLGANGEDYSIQRVVEGAFATKPATDPIKNGYTFLQWSPDVDTTPIYDGDTNVFVPIFVKNDSPTTTGTPTPTPTKTPTPTPTKTPTPTPTPTKTSTTTPSSSQVSVATPYFVTSQDAAPLPQSTTIIINNNNGGNNGNGGNGSGNNPAGNTSNNGSAANGTGNAKVENSRDGISGADKMSATVNGSADNYVVKFTRTQEADDCALAALTAAYGDITPIRYLPFDISLYDSTGTNKISPLPEGMSVTITMPIPDDLAVYGGNAKIASTVGGQIEALTPRFTVINGVPCMNYTVSHLSPYMVYVDTANLTEAGISDATPKTADPIHPKWFLSIGLAALALILLIRKDPEEYIKNATA